LFRAQAEFNVALCGGDVPLVFGFEGHSHRGEKELSQPATEGAQLWTNPSYLLRTLRRELPAKRQMPDKSTIEDGSGTASAAISSCERTVL
jgi:hypothetical protein